VNVAPRFVLAGLAVAGAVAAFVRPAPPTPPAVRDAVAISAVPTARATASAVARVTVYVVGEVRRAGVVTLPADARVDAALRAVGDTTAAADPIAVDRASRLHDGEEIVVPARGSAGAAARASITVDADDDATPAPRRVRRRRAKHRRSRAAATVDVPGTASSALPASADAPAAGENATPLPAAALCDPNRATAESLAAIPGIGSLLAAKIVAFRAVAGPFSETDDLLDVAGMTPVRLERARPYLTVGRAADAGR